MSRREFQLVLQMSQLNGHEHFKKGTGLSNKAAFLSGYAFNEG